MSATVGRTSKRARSPTAAASMIRGIERSLCRLLLFIAFGWLSDQNAPLAAQTPSYTVMGRVVERTHSTWIGGASVYLSGRPVFITHADGNFRFSGVAPGTHTLTVEAMGYRTRQWSILVRADTTLVVEMEVDPIRLDSLLVEAGRITLKGRVVDGVTGRKIPEARVRAGPLHETFTSSGGSFRIKDLPRGYLTPVEVDAYRYLPARIALITERDTTLTIELEPDSLGIRLFAVKTEELERRTVTVPLSVVSINRTFLERMPSRSVYDVIKWRIGRSTFSSQCLFIDEVKQFDTDVLDSYSGGEIERIEVFQRGRMIRIYTQAFIAGNLGRSKAFPKIVFVAGGLGPDTCY